MTHILRDFVSSSPFIQLTSRFCTPIPQDERLIPLFFAEMQGPQSDAVHLYRSQLYKLQNSDSFLFLRHGLPSERTKGNKYISIFMPMT